MNVYFIRKSMESEEVTKRASGYHSVVFHGRSSYPDEFDGDWRPPAQTNSIRQPAHITRSGRYLPAIFGPRIYELLVTDEIHNQLDRLENVEFVEVVFEKLVDLEMPQLGDFSVLDRMVEVDFPPDMEPTPTSYMKLLPDVPEFHETIGRYYSVLGANLYEVESQFDDVEEIRLNFGSYYPRLGRERISTIKFSPSALEQFPIIRSMVQIYREDAFEIIAPHLDFDYFGIAMIRI